MFQILLPGSFLEDECYGRQPTDDEQTTPQILPQVRVIRPDLNRGPTTKTQHQAPAVHGSRTSSS